MAYAQLRNAAPFVELHKLHHFSDSVSDNSQEKSSCRIWIPQAQSCEPRLLGKIAGTDVLSHNDVCAVIETMISSDLGAPESALSLWLNYRRVRGKRARFVEDAPTASQIARILSRMDAEADLMDVLYEYKGPFHFSSHVKIFNRMECASSRGKAYLVSSGWGLEKKSMDYGVLFCQSNGEILHYGEIRQFRAVELKSGEHVVIVSTGGCSPVANSVRAAGLLRQDEEVRDIESIMTVSNIRCKAVRVGDVVVAFDRSWSTVRPFTDSLVQYLSQKKTLIA
jgi:hypothetical protein